MKICARRTALALAACLGTAASLAHAQTRAPADWAAMSIEELMEIKVTSASRKEQRVTDTPAAVYVITQEDIRRSGMTSIPELLRLAPGVQVARINSNSWAISVRGFNDLLSDKVLVLIDGRTVYNPLFAGVFWEAEELLLDDVERIEVVRGPGGALWGANAANGVINIITRKAADTQGLAASVGGGTARQADMAVRYGGTVNNTAFRVFSQFSAPGESRINGASAHDSWQNTTSGFRIDRTVDRNELTVDGAATWGDRHGLWLDLAQFPAQVPLSTTAHSTNAHLLGRWTHKFAAGTSLQVQTFADYLDRDEAIGIYDRRTIDVDVSYHSRIFPAHDVVVGGGVRRIDESFHGKAGYDLSTDSQAVDIVNVFGQDEIALTTDRRVALSLGAKFEHNTLSGASLQPSARVMWAITPETQYVWAAISRAIRTPSVIDRLFSVTYPYGIGPGGLPILAGARGNPDFEREQVIETEVGYRKNIRSTASFDIAGFHASYAGLRTIEPRTPTFELTPYPHLLAVGEFQNWLDARATGFEVSSRWQPVLGWQIDGSYSAFQVTGRPAAASQDPAALSFDANAPAHQWRVHTSVALGSRTRVDTSLAYVGTLSRLGVPEYMSTDVGIERQLGKQLALSFSGSNLTDAAHSEFSASSMLSTSVPRSAHVRLRWLLNR
ncbi:MAG TPA: TonB-dependent receptor plug domain-containing protein [Vicinamibacterales bacterium]|nr:TonB-dependent receptor plug domain-containing protein [Vicinamibacterales bacterium]